jgi:hypothetical protein
VEILRLQTLERTQVIMNRLVGGGRGVVVVCICIVCGLFGLFRTF